jgi:hypothetical protein
VPCSRRFRCQFRLSVRGVSPSQGLSRHPGFTIWYPSGRCDRTTVWRSRGSRTRNTRRYRPVRFYRVKYIPAPKFVALGDVPWKCFVRIVEQLLKRLKIPITCTEPVCKAAAIAHSGQQCPIRVSKYSGRRLWPRSRRVAIQAMRERACLTCRLETEDTD